MANIFPVVMGPLIMGSHVATGWLWFSLAVATTLVSHCGYHLPFLPSPEAHDFHHQKYVYILLEQIFTVKKITYSISV